jgi:hypothetical protein
MPTAVLSFNKFSRQTFIHDSLFVGAGNTTPTISARLHVKGDGTNPIALYQNGAGTTLYSVNNLGVHFISQDGGQSALLGGGGTGLWYLGTSAYNYGSFPQFLTGSSAGFKFGDNITYNDGNSFVWINRLFNNQLDGFGQNQSYKFQNITYTINNPLTSSGTATGIFLNATETALNGMAHNLMDLQVGGVSRFSVNSLNRFTFGTQSGSIWNIVFDLGAGTNPGGYLHWKIANDATNYFSMFQAGGKMQFFNPGGGYGQSIVFSTNGINRLEISSGGLLQLGGTTNAFPAIKRNSAAIDFRLADDSGFCNISAAGLTLSGNIGLNSGAAIYSGTQLRIGAAAISILSDSGADINFTAGASGRGWGVSTATSSGVGASAFLYVGGTATGVTMGSNANAHASALLDMVSTTKGFLPPRMTDTEVRTIPSPAEGLVVFNTDISHFCVYQGGNWVRMSHSPM